MKGLESRSRLEVLQSILRGKTLMLDPDLMTTIERDFGITQISSSTELSKFNTSKKPQMNLDALRYGFQYLKE